MGRGRRDCGANSSSSGPNITIPMRIPLASMRNTSRLSRSAGRLLWIEIELEKAIAGRDAVTDVTSRLLPRGENQSKPDSLNVRTEFRCLALAFFRTRFWALDLD